MSFAFDAAPAVTLIIGKSGCGKTSFAKSFLRRRQSSVTLFIFDWKVNGPGGGEFSKRMGLPPLSTKTHLSYGIGQRCACWNPHVLFPGRLQDAFRFFLAFTYAHAKSLPGEKLLVIDELHLFCGPASCPPQLSTVVETGRASRLASVFLAQQPQTLPGAVTNQVTEAVVFKQTNPNARQRLAEMGMENAERSKSLPRFHYIATNLDSGGELCGVTRP